MGDEITSWLDKPFLVSVLGKDQGRPVSVENFTVRPAVAARNNYTSHLYRVEVEYKVGHPDKNESISLIVKIPIQKGVMYELAQDTGFFTKEPKIYVLLLPKINNLCHIIFGPKAFYCPVKDGVVLQDLKPEGYILIDKLKQLDFEHCKLVMEKLGKFHGTSVVCHHDDPEFIETVGKESFYNRGGNVEEELKIGITSSMKMFINVLQEIGTDQAHIDFINARVDKLYDSMVDTYQPHPNSLNVLNHGDCWSSNMLFKYDESGNVVDVMFIDFQMTRYSSPVSDLLFFVYTSINEEVREKRLQDLYDIYRQTLNETLKQLGCEERLTWEELKEKIKLSSDFVLVTIGFLLPFTKCEAEDAPDMENFTSEDLLYSDKDERLLRVFRAKRYRALLPALIRQYMSLTSP